MDWSWKSTFKLTGNRSVFCISKFQQSTGITVKPVFRGHLYIWEKCPYVTGVLSSQVLLHGEDRTPFWESVPWWQGVPSSQCPLKMSFTVISDKTQHKLDFPRLLSVCFCRFKALCLMRSKTLPVNILVKYCNGWSIGILEVSISQGVHIWSIFVYDLLITGAITWPMDYCYVNYHHIRIYMR